MAQVSYAETKAIQGFLGYLYKNFSKRVNINDPYIVAAVSAWFHQESGGLSHVLGNNPFNIRDSPLQSGSRSTRGNGHFAIFATMAIGFAAAARVLMYAGHGSGGKDQDAYGYRLALKALLHGGNQGAVDFLAALAMSSWDAGRYGTHSWAEAYDAKHNHLLRNYVGITGIQLKDPHPKPVKPPKPPPVLPRDFNYQVSVKNYLDPWARGKSYQYRHGRRSSSIDGTTLKR